MAIGLGVALAGAGVGVTVAVDVSVAANVEVGAGVVVGASVPLGPTAIVESTPAVGGGGDTLGVEASPQPASAATLTNTLTMSHGHMAQFYQTKYPQPDNHSPAAFAIPWCELGSGRKESGAAACRYESPTP